MGRVIRRTVRRPGGELVTDTTVDLSCLTNDDPIMRHAADLLGEPVRGAKRVVVTRRDGFTETFEGADSAARP